MPRKGSLGEISVISDKIDRVIPGSPGYVIVKSFRAIWDELNTQGKVTASVSQNGVLQIFEVGNQAPVNVDLDPNSPGTANQAARRDHHHHLDEDIAPTWTSPHAWAVPSAEITDALGALNLTCTLPVPAAAGTGVAASSILVTTPTSSYTPTNQSHALTGFNASILPGYTGTGSSYALGFSNTVAGTGTSMWEQFSGGAAGVGANRGIFGRASATTTGHNVGARIDAFGGAANAGIAASSYQPKASAVNVALAALAFNQSNVNGKIGAFIGLYGPTTVGADFTPPNLATMAANGGAALIVDNGNQGADTPVARFKIAGVDTILVNRLGGLYCQGPNMATGTVPLLIDRNDSTTAAIFQVRNGTATANFYRIDSGGNVVLQDGTGDSTSLLSVGQTALAATYSLGLNFKANWGATAGTTILSGITATAGVISTSGDNASATAPYGIGGYFAGYQSPQARTHSGLVGGLFQAWLSTIAGTGGAVAHGSAYGWWVKACSRLSHGTSTLTAMYGGYIENLLSGSGGPSATSQQGLVIDKQTGGSTNNNSILLNDSGAGSTYKALVFRDQNTWINANDDSHLDLHAATSVDVNADLEMASGKYVRLPSDGGAYAGSAAPSGFGQLFVISGGSGTQLGFEDDSGNECIITNGTRVEIDVSVNYQWSQTQSFNDTPGIQVDSMDDNGSGQILFTTDIQLGGQTLIGTNPGVDIGGNNGYVSFFGGTPIQRPSGSSQAAITGAGGSYDGTLVSISGTGDDTNINNNFEDLRTLVNALRTALVNLNAIQGS